MTVALRRFVSEEQALSVRLDALSHTPVIPRAARRHWRCANCGAWCDCTGDARLMPHNPCGLTPERS